MINCGHCGRPLDNGTAVCPGCGAQVGRQPSTAESVRMQQPIPAQPAQAGANQARLELFAKICKYFSMALMGWSAVCVWATYEVLLPAATSWYEGAPFDADTAMAILELLSYALGFVGGVFGLDGSFKNPKASYNVRFRAVVAACLCWVGALCMPASGIAHLTYCTVCATPFSRFSPGMWTHFIVMLVAGAVFTAFAVMRFKRNPD